MPTDPWPSRWRLVLSVLILYHLAAIVMVEIRVGTWPLAEALRPVFVPYLTTFDLTQGWVLFAPDPPARNAYVDAHVRFSDGSIRVCALPTTWSPDRGQSVRFRHWEYMLGKDDAFRRMRPDTARWLARVAQVNGSVPRQVTLMAHRLDIAPPDKVFLLHSQWHMYPDEAVIFDYLVQPDDVR